MKMSMIKSVTLSALAMSVAVAGASVTAQAKDMTIASWVGPKHVMNSAGLEPFGETMKAAGFNVKFYPGGSLLKARTLLGGLRDGVTDVGVLSYTFYPSELSNGALIAELGVGASNGMAAAAAANEYQLLHCADCIAEFRRNNVVFVAGHATSTYALMSTTPIREAADLKGKKMRVAGSSWSQWARYVGGIDVSMPAGDMFDALSKGNIDIAIHAPNSLRSFSLWDVAKYTTLADLGAVASVGTFVFNRDFWLELSPEERRLIAQDALGRIVDVTLGYAADDARTLAEAAEKGVEIIPASESLLEQKREFVAASVEEAAIRARDVLKVADPDAKVETIRSLMSKWDGLIDADTPRDEVVALMKAHIFDKVDFGSYESH